MTRSVVEIGGKTFRVEFSSPLPEQERSMVSIDGRSLKVTWYPHAAVIIFADEQGLERNVRYRFAACGRQDSSGDIEVDCELIAFGQTHKVPSLVKPDLPTSLARSSQVAGRGQTLRSQITGKVLQVLVKNGDSVTAGQALIIVEAMKMENRIFAPAPGLVDGLAVQAGDAVQTGKELLRLLPCS